MEYSNPELPEGINTTQTSHLKEFFVLSVGVIGIVIIVITAMIVIVDNFADKIPFEAEKQIPIGTFFESNKTEELPVYLNQITQKVITSSDLPEGMEITVHYVNDETINAFATLGGHIILYRGLLEKLKHEDELAMLIGHEVAHVKHRHPILSASHGIVVGVVLTLVNASAGTSVISDLLGQTSMMTLMKYSREFEYQSDKDAREALVKIYGHAKGALGLFEVFNAERGAGEPIEFFSTHPLTDNRIQQTKLMIKQNSDSGIQNEYTPLPKAFIDWLASQKEVAGTNKAKKDKTP